MSAIAEPLIELAKEPEVTLPVPCGYQILIRMPEIKKTHGSLFLPESRVIDERIAGIIAEVVAIGPDAYMGTDAKGNTFFHHGPYCKVGDYIMIDTYSGVRCQVGPEGNSREYRFINDTAVIAVVPDPAMVRRNL